MDKQNSVQFGVVMNPPGLKSVTVYVYSKYAAIVSQSVLMNLLRRQSCRIDSEALLSKLVLEMIDFHVGNSYSSDELHMGITMVPHVNQMFVVDVWKNSIHSTCMETRKGNFRMSIDEFLTEYEKRAQL